MITHRLSAVQLADVVAVFDAGNVVEYGTHEELYNKGGVYTEMFEKQAQFYREEKNGKPKCPVVVSVHDTSRIQCYTDLLSVKIHPSNLVVPLAKSKGKIAWQDIVTQ